jgi:hypothetical protein
MERNHVVRFSDLLDLQGAKLGGRVVCPLALVGQWASEVEKMTRLRVLKHQGTSRTTGE